MTSEQLRAAFNSDSVPEKNIALRKASTEIERLQEQIATLRELREYDRTKIERLTRKLEMCRGESVGRAHLEPKP